MPRQCSVCSNPLVSSVDEDLRNGVSVSTVSRNHAISHDAVGRHLRSGHVSAGRVIPIASKASLLSSDLRVRAHGIVAMADAALREAERAGATITALKLLRGKAAALKQAIRTVRPAAAVVTDDQREAMESDYRRAVALFGSASTPTATIMSLETLRACWETLWRASPPADGIEIYVDPRGLRACLPRGEDDGHHYPWAKDSIVRHFGLDVGMVERATRVYIVPALQGNSTVSLQTESGEVLFEGRAPASGGW